MNLKADMRAAWVPDVRSASGYEGLKVIPFALKDYNKVINFSLMKGP
jgi:hypothetical protein